eukprot:18233-Chlamydomonas_euryale.AAC.5
MAEAGMGPPCAKAECPPRPGNGGGKSACPSPPPACLPVDMRLDNMRRVHPCSAWQRCRMHVARYIGGGGEGGDGCMHVGRSSREASLESGDGHVVRCHAAHASQCIHANAKCGPHFACACIP